MRSVSTRRPRREAPGLRPTRQRSRAAGRAMARAMRRRRRAAGTSGDSPYGAGAAEPTVLCCGRRRTSTCRPLPKARDARAYRGVGRRSMRRPRRRRVPRRRGRRYVASMSRGAAPDGEPGAAAGASGPASRPRSPDQISPQVRAAPLAVSPGVGRLDGVIAERPLRLARGGRVGRSDRLQLMNAG